MIDNPDAPPCENEEEIITDVVLTWTPTGGGDPIVVRAQDPDGEGPMELQTEDLSLVQNTEYTLSIELSNSIEGEDITEEIREEDDEHMFFFGWTDGMFTDPAGDGNIDNRPDSVAYLDFDENGLPVGLQTRWETSAEMMGGSFRVVLKHQPDLKDENTTVNDGGTDVDLTFNFSNVVTSIDDPIEAARPELLIAPNPVNDLFNWKLEGVNTGNVQLRIFSMAGQLLQSHQSPAPNISVAELPRGVYLIQISSDQGIWTTPLIKN